jgi:hypothetical protein
MAAERSLFADLRCLVRLGLVEFWLQALPAQGAVLPLLRRELTQHLGFEQLPSWKQFRDEVIQKLSAPLEHPWDALINDHSFTAPDLFVLALLGEVEASHSVNMALAELQAPERSGRPSVHLVSALLEALFGESPAENLALDLSQNSLLQSGLVSLQGDGPMPLRQLVLPAVAWSVLGGRSAVWPGCTLLADEEADCLAEHSRVEVDTCAALLDQSVQVSCRGLVVRGTPGSGRSVFAACLAAALGRKGLLVPQKVWENQPALRALCPYAGWVPILRPAIGPGETFDPSAPGFSGTPTPTVVVILGTDGGVVGDDLLEVRMALPTEVERVRLWQQVLGDDTLGRRLGASALLSGKTIKAIGANARRLARREGCALALRHVYEAHCRQGVEKLRLLAEPVHRRVDRGAMVVPEAVRESLDMLLRRTRYREAIWRGLGKTLQATPNPGVRALFVGESGTGKTLAASYIASELGAPLYRVDLSSVMNKYIGESEKNLAQLLDQAAATDVVLLFDEADSLFGSRTEGKETGERFANMLTNFLLSRIENHPGVVILTTNSKERIDTAFNRRIDIAVEFPRPDFAERLALWRSHFGDRGPGETIYRTLASYSDLAGGQVRNAVLAAATRAGGDTIGVEDLLFGLRMEYDKLGRPVPAQLKQLSSVTSQKDVSHA